MGVTSTIEVVLALLGGVLAAVKPLPGLQNVITALEAAIESLVSVQNDPVSMAQINSLKLGAF